MIIQFNKSATICDSLLLLQSPLFEVNPLTVQRGGSVTIPYFYEDSYKTDVKYWCRGSRMSSCTPIVLHPNSPKISGEVSIRDDPDQQLFTVTMNNLTAGDSGYYWCGVEISGGSAVGTRVSLSVTEGKMLQTVLGHQMSAYVYLNQVIYLIIQIKLLYLIFFVFYSVMSMQIVKTLSLVLVPCFT
uniref:Immunoglobulin domain-containing protein n=1 Tax=Paramormyrops kingsleyae TaxID=1676925 RepID=A0A3B3SZC8_9TELE